jgi:BirA family biotin operon repressor/biotin-[acetyl-CoA-carboxylase] ligase
MAGNPYESIEKGTPGTIGWRIHYVDELSSTQDHAAQLARDGARHGTVVIAEKQTKGRGRMGRNWHSPAGLNLYLTIVLRPAMPLAEVPRLSLMAGVAAAEAVGQFAPGMIALKWPNDLWLRGRKAGGMIAEAITDRNHQLGCVLLGIGINVNLRISDVPEELRSKATSIRIETGSPCDRIGLAVALFDRLQIRYREMEHGGFDAIRVAWESYSALTGRTVTVIDGSSRTAGRVSGIDSDGALILETASGRVRVLTGDVSIEGAYDRVARDNS